MTQHEDEVRIGVMMNAFNATAYLLAGARVGKEHVDELNVLDVDGNTSTTGQMP